MENFILINAKTNAVIATTTDRELCRKMMKALNAVTPEGVACVTMQNTESLPKWMAQILATMD